MPSAIRDTQLLVNLLVNPFYQQNAGLLFTLFFICFGLFPGIDMMLHAHMSIMLAICTSVYALLGSMLIWLAYAYKTFAFVTSAFRLHQNEFLNVIGLGTIGNTARLFLIIQTILFLPVLIYSLITAYVGYNQGLILPSISILIFNVFVIGAGAFAYSNLVRHPYKDYSLPIPEIKTKFKIPFHLFYISYVIQQEKLMLLVSKVISISLLWGGFYLAEKQDLDSRFVLLSLILSVTTHMVLIQKFRQFEDYRMGWMPNLPFSSVKRFGYYLIFFFLILLPEFVFVIKYVPQQLQFSDYFPFILAGVCIASYYHIILFKENMNEEKYLNQVLGTWLALTMAVQFKVPALVISAILLSYSFFLYKKRFYLYEPAG